jgi:hypothetical protein
MVNPVSEGEGREQTGQNMRFKVPTVARIIMIALWDFGPCSLVDIHRRFRGYCLHPSPLW